nr:MAG TPA: hypothetical protein [Bacteriophage sp.]
MQTPTSLHLGIKAKLSPIHLPKSWPRNYQIHPRPSSILPIDGLLTLLTG